MPEVSRNQRLIVAAVIALGWAIFGALRFVQGLDLSGQGLWVLGASIESGGEAVHAVIDTGDGPLPYILLGTWMRLFGESFVAAAHLQTVLHLLVAVLLGLWTLRHGTTAVLLGQLALLAGAPLPNGALIAATGLLLGALLPARGRPSLVAGLFLAGAMTLDAGWFLAGLLLAIAQHHRQWRGLAGGLAIGVGLVVVQALASGAGSATLANALGGPWSTLAASGPFRVFDTLVSGAWLRVPFAGLQTGEVPGPAWPAHAWIRSTGLRLLGAAVLVSPLALWWARRNAAAAWLATAAALLVLVRGDVPGIVAAGSLTGVAWALAGPARPSWVLAVVVLALLVPAGENAWLAASSGRGGLETWESPRVGVRLDEGRARSLQAALRELHLHDEQPALVWPDLAGLHFLLGSRPVVRDLAPGDDARSAEALRRRPAPVVLLAPRQDLLPQRLERSHPETATELRRNFRLRGALAAGGLNLRAFEQATGSDDPLAARLPRVESIVATQVQELSPALRDELSIGQSFRIEEDDLQGFAIRLVTQADSVDVQLRARLWEKPGSEYNSLLAARTLELTVRRDQPMQWVNFPVVDTAGRDLALVFETMETPRSEVRFAWNENATLGDVYPWGSAMLDLTPVEADLVILIY